LVDDIAQILYKNFAFGGEVLVWGRESLGVQGGVEGDIALFVLFGVKQCLVGNSATEWDTRQTNRGELAILESYRVAVSDCDD
jgi:hypothetical protein